MKKQIILNTLIVILLVISGCKKKDKDEAPAPVAPASAVETAAVSNINSNTAVGGGNILDGLQSITQVGLCWDVNSSPTTLKPHASVGFGTGSFTCAITGLQPSTLYYVRAYAVHANGTSYGNEVSFTTKGAWSLVANPTPLDNVYGYNSGLYGLGGSGDVYRSTDDGVTLTNIKGDLTTYANNIVEHAGVMFVSGNVGVAKAAIGSTSWTNVNTGLPANPAVNYIVSNGTDLFVALNSGVYRSSDNGNTWSITGFTANTEYLYISGSTLLSKTSTGLFRSTDNGVSWSSITSSFASPFYMSSCCIVGSKIYVSLSAPNEGIWVSSDNGATWAISKTGFGRYLIAHNGDLYASHGFSIFVLRNGETTWSNCDNGLPGGNYYYNRMAIKGNKLFAIGVTIGPNALYKYDL